MTRLEANRELIKLLAGYSEQYPDQRFSQILQNLWIVKPERPAHPDLGISWQNEFYMESEDLLKRVVRKMKDTV